MSNMSAVDVAVVGVRNTGAVAGLPIGVDPAMPAEEMAEVAEDAEAAAGTETAIGRGVGMAAAAPAAGTGTEAGTAVRAGAEGYAPLALPRSSRPDCVSDGGGCAMRCERRLLRSIMLMAQASRSTAVRFEAWMKGSDSYMGQY